MSAASSPAMPGAYRFPRGDLSISTRPISTFSTDTVFFSPTDADDDGTDLAAELDLLEQLRQDVHNRLTLRPIPGLDEPHPTTPASSSRSKRRSLELETPASATSSVFSYTTAPNSPSASVYSPIGLPPTSINHTLGRTSHPHHSTFTASLPDIHNPPSLPLNTTHTTPEALAQLFSSPSYIPLIIDTRPPQHFEQIRLPHSVNLAIPSLILKRCRKPGGGFHSLDALKTYLTTESSRVAWDMLMSTNSPVRWNGDIIVTDESMEEQPGLGSSHNNPGINHLAPSSTAWALLPALSPLANGRTTYLRGGLSAARLSQDLRPFLVGDEVTSLPATSSPSTTLSPTVASPYGTMDSVLWSYLNATPSPSMDGVAQSAGLRFTPRPSPLPSRLGRERSPSPLIDSEAAASSKKLGLFSLKTTDSHNASSRSRENRLPVVDSASSSDHPHHPRNHIQQHPPGSTPSSSASSHTSQSSSSNSQPPSRNGSTSSGASNGSGTSGISRRTTSAGSHHPGSGHSSHFYDYDASPSPSPSASSFPLPRGLSRNRGMTLGIDTSSAERLRESRSDLRLPSQAQAPSKCGGVPLSPLQTQPSRLNGATGPPKLHLRTLPPTKSSTLDIPPSSPGAGPSGFGTSGGGGLGGLGRLRLPRSPHRPNLIITSSPTSGMTSNDDGDEIPSFARGGDRSQGQGQSASAQYLEAGPSQSLSLRDRRSRSSSRDRTDRSQSPTNRSGSTSGSTSRRRSPSPYLRSPATARPTEGFDFGPAQGDGGYPPVPSPRMGGSFPSSFSSSMSEDSPLSHPNNNANGGGPDAFVVSTILPNFLYLGPEMSTPEHAAEVKALGVKRVLNMAIECDDEWGFSSGFERYLKIPMRDTVEEENVKKGVREVCQFLDDARLHSQPTYVHCKAGKSRSVTAVMAYLIHANHWPLAQAYAFVLDRRRGISPNIGFVSELMSFEEEELGGKSLGVVSTSNLPQVYHSGSASTAAGGGLAGADGTPMPPGGSGADDRPSAANSTEGGGGGFVPGHGHSQSVIVGGAPYGGMMGPLNSRRGPHHIRESLPPAFAHQPASIANMHSSSSAGGADASGDQQTYGPPELGDAMAHAQEVEVKDADGRYRHARRAPVDELTLQPMRRVSKAGLESSNWMSLMDSSSTS